MSNKYNFNFETYCTHIYHYCIYNFIVRIVKMAFKINENNELRH